MLVLVADDDRAVREALERALQLHGYEVALASDGDTALSAVDSRTPDAVAVSSDGLLMAMSSTLERAGAEQLAAIIAGMTSLAESTARCFALGGLDQVIVAMEEGYLFVASVSDGSSLGVVADGRLGEAHARADPDGRARPALRQARAGP